LCRKHQITFQSYSSLEMGLLTGKITMDYEVPPGYVRNRVRWYEPTRRQMLLSMLEGWKPLCEKYNCTLSNLTIALTTELTPFMNVLCGARKVFQIEDNAKGGDRLLQEEGKLTPDPKYRY
jgi:methylglyoxal reductase